MNYDPEVKYFGKYKGLVRDIKDPEERGRIRVFCQQVMGTIDDSDHWLDWAEPCFPWFGGLNTLDFGVPPIPTDNDGESVGVWIEFEAGIVDNPIWVGTGVFAPYVDGKHSQINKDEVVVMPGGDLFENVVAGAVPGTTNDDIKDFNPLKLQKTKEVHLVVKAGIDLVLISERGGAIVIGPSGVNIIGNIVTVNGRIIKSDLDMMYG